MLFKSLLASVSLALPAFSASFMKGRDVYYPSSWFNKTIAIDTTYDDGSYPFSSTACPSLESQWTTLDDIYVYPSVAGSYLITADDQSYCGTCWSLTIHAPPGSDDEYYSIVVVAVDSAPANTFATSTVAYNTLIPGDQLIYAEQVPDDWCLESLPGKGSK